MWIMTDCNVGIQFLHELKWEFNSHIIIGKRSWYINDSNNIQ